MTASCIGSGTEIHGVPSGMLCVGWLREGRVCGVGNLQASMQCCSDECLMLWIHSDSIVWRKDAHVE